MNSHRLSNVSSFTSTSASSTCSPSLQWYFANVLRDGSGMSYTSSLSSRSLPAVIPTTSSSDLSSSIHHHNHHETEEEQQQPQEDNPEHQNRLGNNESSSSLNERLSLSCSIFEILPDDAKSHMNKRTVDNLRATMKKMYSASRLDRWDCEEQHQIQIPQSPSPIHISPEPQLQQKVKVGVGVGGGGGADAGGQTTPPTAANTPSPSTSITKQSFQKPARLPSIILEDGENFVIVGGSNNNTLTTMVAAAATTSTTTVNTRLENSTTSSSTNTPVVDAVAAAAAAAAAPSCTTVTTAKRMEAPKRLPSNNREELQRVQREAMLSTKKYNSDSLIFRKPMRVPSYTDSSSSLPTPSNKIVTDDGHELRSPFAICVTSSAKQQQQRDNNNSSSNMTRRKRRQQQEQQEKNSNDGELSSTTKNQGVGDAQYRQQQQQRRRDPKNSLNNSYHGPSTPVASNRLSFKAPARLPSLILDEEDLAEYRKQKKEEQQQKQKQKREQNQQQQQVPRQEEEDEVEGQGHGQGGIDSRLSQSCSSLPSFETATIEDMPALVKASKELHSSRWGERVVDTTKISQQEDSQIQQFVQSFSGGFNYTPSLNDDNDNERNGIIDNWLEDDEKKDTFGGESSVVVGVGGGGGDGRRRRASSSSVPTTTTNNTTTAQHEHPGVRGYSPPPRSRFLLREFSNSAKNSSLRCPKRQISNNSMTKIKYTSKYGREGTNNNETITIATTGTTKISTTTVASSTTTTTIET